MNSICPSLWGIVFDCEILYWFFNVILPIIKVAAVFSGWAGFGQPVLFFLFAPFSKFIAAFFARKPDNQSGAGERR
jgi:hypothetical protein